MIKRWGRDYLPSADRQTDWLQSSRLIFSLPIEYFYNLFLHIILPCFFDVGLTGAVLQRACELSTEEWLNVSFFVTLVIEKEHEASLAHKHDTQRLNHTAQYFSKNLNFQGWRFSAAHKALWPLRVSHQLLAPAKAEAIFLSLQLAQHDF